MPVVSVIKRGGQPIRPKAEKREIVVAFIVTVLFGAAFTESVAPIRHSIRAGAETGGTIAFMTVLFLTNVRFFIGNQFHFLDRKYWANVSGLCWIIDLMVVIVEAMLLIFAAGVCSVEASRAARCSFCELLVALWVTDVGWIVLQWAASVIPKLARPSIPWPWAIINAVLAVLTLAAYAFGLPLYTDKAYFLLVAANVAAFAADVYLDDRYDVI